MTHFKQLLLPALVLVLILSSCTVNHPLYTSNYHIEWKKYKYNNSKYSNNNSQNKINAEPTTAKAFIHEQADTSITQNTHINYNNTASTDRSIIIPSKKLDLNGITASTKNTNSVFHANEKKSKIAHKKSNSVKTEHNKTRKKTKDSLKALFIFILAVVLTGLALTYISLFGSYFLFSMIVGGVILLTLGILIILGT